jgi:hypothetical protein
MKKIFIVFSLLAAVVSCAGPSLSVKDGSVFYGKAKVGTLMSGADEYVSYCDRVEKIDHNTIRVVRTFTALEDVDSVRLTLDFRHDSECAFAMIPSVCYNGNDWGRGEEPKGFKTDGVCHTYSYRRTPIPGATYSEGKDFSVAMWGVVPDSEEDAFSCSLMPEESYVIHSLIYPEEEQPFTYSNRDSYSDGRARRFSMRKGDTRSIEAYLHVSAKEDGRYLPASFLDKAWELADKEYAEVMPPEKIWEYGVRYAKEYLWAEENEYKGFSIGLVPDEDGRWKQRPFGKYEVGWCGQNASFANSLLVDYIKSGDKTSLDKALATIDTWTSPVLQYDNGLYVTHYDNILDSVERPVSDACNLGTAAYNFFEAAGLLESCGQTGLVERLRNTALGICNFVKADQQTSGVYGRGWYPDGECYVREGTVGAFMIAPMIRAYDATSDVSYLESAKKAFDYYYGEFERLGYTTAGALDTWCIDKESSMPILRSALMLYDATGDRSYIDKAENVSYYLSTWLWHYKADFAPEEDAARYGYNTFGATSVSTQHHHLDVYAVMWVAEWLKLAELSGNDMWHEKALAVWTNSCQFVSDGTLEINGHIRPAGSQNEAFFECNWGGYPENKRINDWLVAWPGAFRLETLRTLSDWSVME